MDPTVIVRIPVDVAESFLGQDLKKYYRAKAVLKNIIAATLDRHQELRFRVQLLACKGCGRQSLAMVQNKSDGGHRLTSHKCGGHWNAREIFDCKIHWDDFWQYIKG